MTKIYTDKFKDVLRKIPQLSYKERKYTEKVFRNAIKGGLNKSELIKEISRLRNKKDDPLDSYEINRIKRQVLKHLK